VHQTCDELGLEYLPTNANFLMHRIKGDLRAYIDRMREAGILVGRPFPPMLEWNRLSFGLPDEMDRWASTLKDFRQKGWV
jgi:histidinol-phosphate aminotransferase